ncbi:MAG: DUF4364 family protein [Firmicutes bacterium]|nr:DUF4364 family protein [Bacillota bacterium]
MRDENTKNKLLVLFVLEKLEMPVTEDNLTDICSMHNNWIPGLYMKQVLFELIRSGFVTTVQSDSTRLLTITVDGRTCLAHFFNDIPLSLREDATEFIKEHRLTLRKKQEFLATHERNQDGSFTLSLKILEVSKPLIDLKISAPTRNRANAICASWKDRAPEVYRALNDILLDN